MVLAIPLFLSLRQIVWETQATRQANNVVIEVFDGRATISQLEPSFDTSPMRVTATVLIWREKPHERIERLALTGREAVCCPVCGYNLTGLTEARCPECGARFTLDQLIATQPQRDRATLPDG